LFVSRRLPFLVLGILGQHWDNGYREGDYRVNGFLKRFGANIAKQLYPKTSS
jgi:hypothetical protein